MITVKTTCYNDYEVTTAMCCFDVAEEFFRDVYCEGRCEDCNVKHLCYDLTKVKEYLEKVHNERGCK